MHKYHIWLWPEKGKTETIHLESTKKTVLQVADAYSNAGKKAANRKWIEDGSVAINGDCIKLILCSDAWLNVPTKALRGFISMLSKTPEYKDLITSSGRLFKGESEYIPEGEVLEEELSDEQILIEVTKLFFRENEENRKKINAIREILGGKKNV